jgi:hypothetical protein
MHHLLNRVVLQAILIPPAKQGQVQKSLVLKEFQPYLWGSVLLTLAFRRESADRLALS